MTEISGVHSFSVDFIMIVKHLSTTTRKTLSSGLQGKAFTSKKQLINQLKNITIPPWNNFFSWCIQGTYWLPQAELQNKYCTLLCQIERLYFEAWILFIQVSWERLKVRTVICNWLKISWTCKIFIQPNILPSNNRRFRESERIHALDDYGLKCIVLTDVQRTLRECKLWLCEI